MIYGNQNNDGEMKIENGMLRISNVLKIVENKKREIVRWIIIMISCIILIIILVIIGKILIVLLKEKINKFRHRAQMREMEMELNTRYIRREQEPITVSRQQNERQSNRLYTMKPVLQDEAPEESIFDRLMR